MMKSCVLDIETTGKNEYCHAIYQFSGEIYVDGELQEVFDFRMRPFENDDISPKALAVGEKTLDEIMAYPEPKGIWPEITDVFKKYVDPFDSSDKLLSVGYGNSFFDMKFLPKHAKKCGDQYFWSYFHKHPVDMYHDAVNWLAQQGILAQMPNMKLATVYETAFGTPLEGAHVDAKNDVKAARDLCNLLRPGLLTRTDVS